MKKIISYLNSDITQLLSDEPFCSWTYKKSEINDVIPPETHYEFNGNGLELICDKENLINVIFMFVDQGCDNEMYHLPYSWNRQQIRSYFGTPEKSSVGSRHPVLGEIAAWDRFLIDKGAVRFEYTIEDWRIKKITLMRTDAIPN